MLSYIRPVAHPEFADEARMLLNGVRAELAGGKRLDTAGKEIWSGGWVRGNDRTPGKHKRALASAHRTLRKCGYCERVRDEARELQVEHYRPKGGVTDWIGSPSQVLDEPPPEVHVSDGYWWLSFSWENYLLACSTCNGRWKRNLFPVVPPRSPHKEGMEVKEQSLLLHPFEAFETRDHFQWTVDAHMLGRTPRGEATIVACGLNRKELRAERLKVLQPARTALNSFVRALRDNSPSADELHGSIEALGDQDREFAGMVRWLVEEKLNVRWATIFKT